MFGIKMVDFSAKALGIYFGRFSFLRFSIGYQKIVSDFVWISAQLLL